MGGFALGAVASVLPWAADAWMTGMAPPDVAMVVLLNGQPIGYGSKVQDAYNPTWSNRIGPVTMTTADQLDFRATDVDVMFDDHIGVCTTQGVPLVDTRGYAQADSFVCQGQLWAVAVRVQSANEATVSPTP